ncbi:MAG: hypothetical protein RJB31_110 [Bacteroidota bacterium]
MIVDNSIGKRELNTHQSQHDLVVVGGGLSGVCGALAAARLGLRVALVQDRPVLGGNASSEVRLWILGATSHMGNNNRWAREGGIMDEILVENMFRNPEGNPLIFDTILLEKVKLESNITLLLNTAAFEVIKEDDQKISSIKAFCSQNQQMYHLAAPLFVDASGDGILGFLAGAAFRMGAESSDEFDEKFAPSKEYGELLGHSLYFYSKNVGKPVRYVAPSYALKDITKIPRFRSFNAKDFGCKLWWVEYGGRLDTISETETIKWELWKVIYGVWDHIKNSGLFPEAENLTLEWVGTIPGKRESRRFEGDYMLNQRDIVEQRPHADAVAFGGWSIDLHPADGVFSEKPGCNQWHSKGIYQIPYRCLYSKNISNLYIAGRIISASHVAFGSTRVMATSGLVGQVVGTAAYIAAQEKLMPRELLQQQHLENLQQLLLKEGAFIPGVSKKENDLTATAKLSSSSHLKFSGFSSVVEYKPIQTAVAQMMPLNAGAIPAISFKCIAASTTPLEIQLRVSDAETNHTPEIILEQKTIHLIKGENQVEFSFDAVMPYKGYAYITFLKNDSVSLPYTDQRISGILSVFNYINPAVSNWGKQEPKEDIGVDTFEFWCPMRRPDGRNLCLAIALSDDVFGVENIRNGIDRPVSHPNAWVADLSDASPSITLGWDTKREISSLEICFDSDFDHPMESVLMGHPENVMPFCVTNFSVEDENGNILWNVQDNHQTIRRFKAAEKISTQQLTFRFEHPSDQVPAAVFAIRCFND